MNKQYILRLADEERAACEATVKNEKRKSRKLRRAVKLRKADVDGLSWKDVKISEAVGCRIRTGQDRGDYSHGNHNCLTYLGHAKDKAGGQILTQVE